jgi:hypothetical protein
MKAWKEIKEAAEAIQREDADIEAVRISTEKIIKVCDAEIYRERIEAEMEEWRRESDYRNRQAVDELAKAIKKI